LCEQIASQVSKIDEELKAKATEYNNIVHSLSAEERRAGGNLLFKDLSDIVKSGHIVETEYLQTLFIAVPKYLSKLFLATYEKLTEFVLPRSGEVIEEDAEYQLYRVVLFRKVAEDYKNIAKEKKYAVRDFTFDPNKSAKADKKKLQDDKEKLKTNLIPLVQTQLCRNFYCLDSLKSNQVFRRINIEIRLANQLSSNDFDAQQIQTKAFENTSGYDVQGIEYENHLHTGR